MKGKIKSVVFKDAKRWRRWLMVNHSSKNEIWVVLPKKSAGGDSYRVYYNLALEEALCFGWIDSRIRPLELLRKRKMTDAGLKVLPPDVISRLKNGKLHHRQG